MEGPFATILDTSVLINFLVVDQVGLLTRLSKRQFILTDHVRAEITTHYPDQLQRLQSAFESGHFHELVVDSRPEMTTFAQLTETGLGIGECSAIAVAAVRGFHLGLDDKQARKQTLQRFPNVVLVSTEMLMVELIQTKLISVLDADVIKKQWEVAYRFRLPFASFTERLSP
jgi:predicted nucleic acid-binding protein